MPWVFWFIFFVWLPQPDRERVSGGESSFLSHLISFDKTVRNLFETKFVLRDSYLSVSEFEYSISDTVFISEYLNHIFMMSTSNPILSDMIDIIRIQIRIQPEI